MDDERTIPSETRVCRDCGDLFEITGGERVFYDSKDLELPRRCKPCRDARRAVQDDDRRWTSER